MSNRFNVMSNEVEDVISIQGNMFSREFPTFVSQKDSRPL